MNEIPDMLSSLEQICQQQYEEIEKKKIQIWDVEEENRLLRISRQELLETVDKHVNRIDELERWCTHLQGIIDSEQQKREERERKYQQLERRYGVFFRIARKIKRLVIG